MNEYERTNMVLRNPMCFFERNNSAVLRLKFWIHDSGELLFISQHLSSAIVHLGYFHNSLLRRFLQSTTRAFKGKVKTAPHRLVDIIVRTGGLLRTTCLYKKQVYTKPKTRQTNIYKTLEHQGKS